MRLRSIGDVPARFLEDPHCKTIAELRGVESLVLFPDVHIKQKYVEAGYQCAVPSSSVTVSHAEFFYPQIRSRGIGCGMALWPLGIAATQCNDERLETFLLGLLKTWLRRPSLLTRLDEFLGKKAPACPNVVSPGSFGGRRSAWWSVVRDGAAGYLSDHPRAEGVRARFEAEGNHLADPALHPLPDPRTVFSSGFRRGQDFRGGDHLAGLWLRGNHYVELQEVSDVYDSAATARVGLTRGALALMNHSCGNGLESVLAPALVAKRILLPEFRSISPSDPDYRMIRFAVAALKNLGSVRRATFFARAVDAAERLLPDARVGLLAECNHNDIEWRGEQILYRHNAVKLERGRFQVVSGFYNHPSYLVQPGPRSEETHDTVGHGLGAWLSEREFVPDPRRRVVRIGIRPRRGAAGLVAHPVRKRVEVPYFRGDPGDRIVHGLEEAGVIKLVAKLSPLLSASQAW